MEILVNNFNQGIHDSFSLSIDLDDSILTDPISKYENFIFKCSECSDCPRMSFEIIVNKLSIKAYCYSHKNSGKNYNLKAFIDKFGISKEEVIDNDNSLNNSQSLTNFEFENILVIDDDDKEDNLIKRKYCKYCQHQNVYKKYCELGDFLFCDSCNFNQMMNDKNLNIYYNNVRIENIDDLDDKVKNKKINYIEKSIKDAESHINKLEDIKYKNENDKEINSCIEKYIEESNNIISIIKIMIDTYKYYKEQNSLTFPILKNISELIFYFNPIPNENEENYRMKLINYLKNPNNFIINHHLRLSKSIQFKIPDEEIQIKNGKDRVNKITRIIKLPNNRLCVAVNYMIYILNYQLEVLFKFENDPIHKKRIWDIQILPDGRIAILSSDREYNLCSFYKIYENNYELVGTITYDVINGQNFNSFLILSDDYIAIHTWHYLYIFKIPKNINEKTNLIIKEEYSDISVDVYSCLILREKKGNIVSFFSILSGINEVIPWEFNLETEKLNKPFELGKETDIHYSAHIGSVAKYNKDYFVIGGYEFNGFYLVKYSDGKLYHNFIPNTQNHFQGVCVMPDNTLVFGENNNNEFYCLKRYQIIDNDCFLVDNISLETDIYSIKSNPTTIIYLDNSTVIVGDYTGTLSLWK